VKNVLVFAAPLFAFSFSLEILTNLALTFAIFCGLSSGTYLLNDIFDLESDRLHPVKRKRPLASGALNSGLARLVAFLLIAASLAASYVISPLLTLTAGAYIGIQILYNVLLKHILILDMMALASGFVLRAVAGAVAAAVPMSPWFLFYVALLAFYIVLEKRKGELKRMNQTGITTRKILETYSIPYIEQIETATLASLLLGYTLWTIQGAASSWMMLTVPFVLYGILRYQFLSQKDVVERPEEALFQDKPLLVSVILWILASFTILALNHAGLLP
jgi:4-hydroxybenzoate polyprenyltransferase